MSFIPRPFKHRILALAMVSWLALSVVGKSLPLTIHPHERYQTIQGFGCAINAWTAPFYGLYYDDKFTRFAVDELGLSVFRMQMWAGISPTEIADWHDISYKDFIWKSEGLRGKMNVDWARRIVALNPEIKIIGTVWSAPGWMKENGSRTGTKGGYLLNPQRDYDTNNRLREDRYLHFAKWVVEWARYMESQGTPLYAISLQNELVFTQWFESTLYTPEEYARVVQVAGEMFAHEGVRKPLFFGPEDMTMATYEDEVRHRPFVDALMQPEVAPYFDVFATHGYTDGVKGDSRHNVVGYWRSIQQFGRPYWITEGGTGDHAWPAPVTTGIAPQLHVALSQANVSLFTGWQLTGAPGHSTEHEFMTWDQPTPKTYATMQYWRHVRPGAVRVGVVPSTDTDLLTTAFVHEARREAVTVIINQSAEPRDIVIDWAGAAGATWQAWQTSAHQAHAPVVGQAETAGRMRFVLPGYSITTTVAPLMAAGATSQPSSGATPGKIYHE